MASVSKDTAVAAEALAKAGWYTNEEIKPRETKFYSFEERVVRENLLVQ